MRNKTFVGIAIGFGLCFIKLALASGAPATVGALSKVQSGNIAAAERNAAGPTRLGPVAPHEAVDLPQVQAISGVGKKLFAVVVFSSGDSMEVAGGDSLPGGYRVLSVSTAEVVISKGTKLTKLRFGGSAGEFSVPRLGAYPGITEAIPERAVAPIRVVK